MSAILVPFVPIRNNEQSSGISKDYGKLERASTLAREHYDSRLSNFSELIFLELVNCQSFEDLKKRIHNISEKIEDGERVLNNIDLKFLSSTLRYSNCLFFSIFVQLLEPMLENQYYNQFAQSMVRLLLVDNRATARYAALEIIGSGLGTSQVADNLLREALFFLKDETEIYISKYLERLKGTDG
ncbi:hypothetical protein [Oscillatoria salina]|uniref:hypothetical protein n=1 Tax=Oscillatoria salina TaxID=331517 RepID=UPI0013BBCCC7|nr:hypothetical protein [Oscillatoria salina]MBZ8181380.1 hypothetical protein [Oscillatoria salina IIICB1]NET88319.1 hypothetical protein [Kamptonema sp. SIO1D9]